MNPEACVMDSSRIAKQAVADEVDGLLNEWRSKAINIVLAVAVVAALPALVVVLSGRIFYLPLRLPPISDHGAANLRWNLRLSFSCSWRPTRPPVPAVVAERSPSPKGRPGGPRAERSDGSDRRHLWITLGENTSAGVFLSSAECFLSLL